MAEIIAESTVALSLMREALSLLSDPENATAAEHLQRAIATVEASEVAGEQEERAEDGNGQ